MLSDERVHVQGLTIIYGYFHHLNGEWAVLQNLTGNLLGCLECIILTAIDNTFQVIRHVFLFGIP